MDHYPAKPRVTEGLIRGDAVHLEVMTSVIIPTFNRPKELLAAVNSVLQQKLEPNDKLEIIVVDDSSSPAIPRQGNLEHESVKIVRTQYNLGAAGARNIGVEAASGEIIAFLDSDDVWLPDKLLCQLALFRRLCAASDPAQVAVSCACYYPGRFSGRMQSRLPRPAKRSIDFASGCWFCPGSTLLVHKSAFDRVGPLDTRLRRLEDLDWFVRFGRAGGQLHVDPHVGALITPSNSHGSVALAQATAIIEAKFMAGGDLSLPADHQRYLRSYLALERCACSLAEGRVLSAISHLFASLLLKPRLRPGLEKHWVKSYGLPNWIEEANMATDGSRHPAPRKKVLPLASILRATRRRGMSCLL